MAELLKVLSVADAVHVLSAATQGSREARAKPLLTEWSDTVLILKPNKYLHFIIEYSLDDLDS